MKNNVIKKDFNNYKKTPRARQKTLIRIVAVAAALLTISGLIGSIIIYFN